MNDERSARVDRDNMVCSAHRTEACMFCMIDDYNRWRAVRSERLRRLKEERRATAIHERFDLGGEA